MDLYLKKELLQHTGRLVLGHKIQAINFSVMSSEADLGALNLFMMIRPSLKFST